MSLATLERLLAERQHLRAAYRELQAHATDRDFAEKVDALCAKIDPLDQQCAQLVETLVAQRVEIPDLALYDLVDLVLDRLMRRDPHAATRLRLALDEARALK